MPRTSKDTPVSVCPKCKKRFVGHTPESEVYLGHLQKEHVYCEECDRWFTKRNHWGKVHGRKKTS